MRKYSIFILLYLSITSPFMCAAQNDTINLDYLEVPLRCYGSTDNNPLLNIETAGTFSGGDNAPFWLTNNKHGLGSIKNNNGYIRLQTFANKRLFQKFKLQFGVDIVAANNLNSDFHFQQLYADFGYRNVKLSIGSKERSSLFKNEQLSMGGMTLSNNARPIPQVEFSLPDFVAVPYSKGLLEVIGGVSYGKFLDDKFKKSNAADASYAEEVLYHRKYGFLKFENNSVWNFIMGLEMDTQWGGHFYKDGKYKWSSPAGFKDFFRVLLPMSGGSDSNMTDQVNVLGNIYGSLHLITNYRKENYSVKAYIERFFEDHSGLFFKNAPDGLYGVEVNLTKKGWVTEFLFEYLRTKNQSGIFLWDKSEEIPVQISGGDNYYNHIDYISLSNYGFVMGNPLLTSPVYNNERSLTVYNNRLSSFHGGIAGYICSNLKYRALFTYSQSWGTPLIPSRNTRNQFSTMFEATYRSSKVRGWLLSGAFAFDKSEMIGDNLGVQFKLSKAFHIE